MPVNTLINFRVSIRRLAPGEVRFADLSNDSEQRIIRAQFKGERATLSTSVESSRKIAGIPGSRKQWPLIAKGNEGLKLTPVIGNFVGKVAGLTSDGAQNLPNRRRNAGVKNPTNDVLYSMMGPYSIEWKKFMMTFPDAPRPAGQPQNFRLVSSDRRRHQLTQFELFTQQSINASSPSGDLLPASSPEVPSPVSIPGANDIMELEMKGRIYD